MMMRMDRKESTMARTLYEVQKKYANIETLKRI
jgi:hypothetical protein